MKNKINYFFVLSILIVLNSCSGEEFQNQGADAVGSIIGLLVIVSIIVIIVKNISKPKK
jgi:hypothetical protein